MKRYSKMVGMLLMLAIISLELPQAIAKASTMTSIIDQLQQISKNVPGYQDWNGISLSYMRTEFNLANHPLADVYQVHPISAGNTTKRDGYIVVLHNSLHPLLVEFGKFIPNSWKKYTYSQNTKWIYYDLGPGAHFAEKTGSSFVYDMTTNQKLSYDTLLNQMSHQFVSKQQNDTQAISREIYTPSVQKYHAKPIWFEAQKMKLIPVSISKTREAVLNRGGWIVGNYSTARCPSINAITQLEKWPGNKAEYVELQNVLDPTTPPIYVDAYLSKTWVPDS